MPITGQTIDVPLLAPNQQAPVSAGPPGRVAHIVNGVAKKFERGDQEVLRLEKREGFTSLTTTTKDPVSRVSATAMNNPKLAASYADQIVTIDELFTPTVLADELPAWERFRNVVVPNVLTETSLYTSGNQAQRPDGAAIGGIFCYVWVEQIVSGEASGTAKATIVDRNGTPIMLPVALVTNTNVRVKVVADGTHFWVFTAEGTALAVRCYDTAGVLVDTNSFATAESFENQGDSAWDVQYNTLSGVTWIGSTSSGNFWDLAQFVLTSGSIAVSHVNLGTNISNAVNPHAVAFLISKANDRCCFAVADFGAGIHVYDIVTLTPFFTFNAYTILGSAPNDNVSNMCGYIEALQSRVTLVYSQINRTTPTSTFTTKTRITFPSTAVTTTFKGVAVASRMFYVGNLPAWVAYYASQKTYVDVNGTGELTQGQPTFFLIEASDPTVRGQIIGRWSYGLAAMDWTVGRAGFGTFSDRDVCEFAFNLPSAFTDDTGALHVPLGYRAEQVNQTTTVQGNDIVRSFILFRQASTIGLRDYALESPTTLPRQGRPVEYAGELLIPGPQAGAFFGNGFAADGIALAPEQPTATPASGGSLTAGVEYDYAIVFEGNTTSGQRVRSIVSKRLTVKMGTNTKVTLAGVPLWTTDLTDLHIAVYRNIRSNGAMTTAHYKTSDDLTPLINDPTAASWTFVDTNSDQAIAVNEQLYTDNGTVDHEPAPPFRAGCVWQNRVFLIGYDNALWFSAEKQDGEALWFSGFFRVPLPFTERAVRIAPLDGRILIGTERGWWALEGAALPGPTGLGGNIQAPQKLPFTNGCTGLLDELREGVIYSSTSNGLPWIITRGLENVQIGATAADDFDGETIVSMATDQNHRTLIGCASGKVMLWDEVSGVWSRWTIGTGHAYFALAHRGILHYVDTAVVKKLVAGTFTDDGAAILSTYEIQPVHLGGVKNYKRVWDVQIHGSYLGDHDLSVSTTYDDDTTKTVSVFRFTPDASNPYDYSIPPDVELCSSIAFTFEDSFPRTAGNSFALELISFYVALETGLNRIPIAARIRPEDVVVMLTGDNNVAAFSGNPGGVNFNGGWRQRLLYLLRGLNRSVQFRGPFSSPNNGPGSHASANNKTRTFSQLSATEIGDTMSRIERYVTDTDPDLVVYYVGVLEPDFTMYVPTIVDPVLALNTKVRILAAPLWPATGNGFTEPDRATYNTGLQAAITGHTAFGSRLFYAPDIASALTLDTDDYSGDPPDNFNFSGKGAKKIADIWYDTIVADALVTPR